MRRERSYAHFCPWKLYRDRSLGRNFLRKGMEIIIVAILGQWFMLCLLMTGITSLWYFLRDNMRF